MSLNRFYRGIINTVKKAVEEFNRYREPEVKAEFLGVEGDILQVRFSGSFCHACGFYDHFEDFMYVLEDLGLKVEIKEIREGETVKVKFKLLGVGPGENLNNLNNLNR